MSDQRPVLEPGATATFTKTITPADVETFAEISGDHNPIHLDQEYAAGTRFGQRIAHGMYVASFISAALGEDFPGPGSIYLSQSLAFKAPVYMGDTITATAEIVKVREDKPIVTFKTTCTNQDGVAVVEGEAVLLCPQLT